MSPKTAAGRAIVRLNGVRHGMRSFLPVPKTESAAEWERHRAGILASLDPVAALEMALGERVALLLWRLQRVDRFETAVITQAQEKAADDRSEREALYRVYTRAAVEARAGR